MRKPASVLMLILLALLSVSPPAWHFGRIVSAQNTALNRTTVALLTNKSGGALVYGDVVVLDNTNAKGFTTTTTAGLSTRGIGVILEPNGIANNATGTVALGGWVPKINLNTAATVGQFLKTHTVAGQATPHSSPQVEGDFAVALQASATPEALLFGMANGPLGNTPTDAEYLVETANGTLTNEVVTGTTYMTTAAYASRQAAAKAGRLFLPSNGFYVERDTGSAWASWGPIFPMTPPVDGDFAWINQGGASVTTTNGGIFLRAPVSSGTNLRIRKKSAPSTPYVITGAFIIHAVSFNFQAGGMLFRQSSDGKVHALQVASGTAGVTIGSLKFSSATAFSADYQARNFTKPDLVWLRIADNGTNRICSYSMDGQNFITFHTIGRTDYLTADEVGFFANDETNTYETGVTLLSWVQG